MNDFFLRHEKINIDKLLVTSNFVVHNSVKFDYKFTCYLCRRTVKLKLINFLQKKKNVLYGYVSQIEHVRIIIHGIQKQQAKIFEKINCYYLALITNV